MENNIISSELLSIRNAVAKAAIKLRKREKAYSYNFCSFYTTPNDIAVVVRGRAVGGNVHVMASIYFDNYFLSSYTLELDIKVKHVQYDEQ